MIGEIKIKNKDAVEHAMINKHTMKSFPDIPLVICPRCRLLVPDWDGFGVLSHAGEIEGMPDYPAPCGYCRHPALEGNVCCICGEEKGSEAYEERKKTRRQEDD